MRLAGMLLAGLLAGGLPTAARDDLQTVCRSAAATVDQGLRQFTEEMRQVSSLARSDDLAAAEERVRAGGATLLGVGDDLADTGARAEDGEIRAAVADLAAEFHELGGQLTDLASLQTVDPGGLEARVKALGSLCGADFPARPSESAESAPTRTGTPSAIPG